MESSSVKELSRFGRLGDFIGAKVAVHLADQGIQAGEQPAVHDGERFEIERIFGRIKPIYIRIKHIERIGVPKRTKKLALPLDHSFSVEPVGQPRRGIGIEVPADRVCAVGFERFKRIDRIALRFGSSFWPFSSCTCRAR